MNDMLTSNVMRIPQSYPNQKPRSFSGVKNGLHTGFTLVEMLVVMAILAILVSIMYPSISTAFDAGKDAQCRSNLGQWVTFFKTYCTDNDGQFTNGYYFENEDRTRDSNQVGWARGQWVTALHHYWQKDTDLLTCPYATEPRTVGSKVVAYGGAYNTYEQGKKNKENAGARSSYGFNCYLYNPPDYQQNGKPLTAIQGRPVKNHFRSITGLQDSSNVPVMLDSMWRGGGPDATRSHRNQPPQYPNQWAGWKYEMMHFAIGRHGQSQSLSRGRELKVFTHAGFADGSVRKVSLKELWSLEWHRGYQPISVSWPSWMRVVPEKAE